MSILKTINRLTAEKKMSPPDWLVTNSLYLVTMGSVAYGVSEEDSDHDVYGICVPPKSYIFPHLSGHIQGFGTKPQSFDQYQQHHVYDESAKKVYDFSIFNIVKFFDLLMANNPNVVDSMYVPRDCVLYSNQVGEMIRENRKMFLNKGLWTKFRGYAYSQLSKMSSQDRTGKRKEVVEEHGYDLKFAYHVVRLLNEAEQLLENQDMDMRRDREMLKAIRRGEWSEKGVRDWFGSAESRLDNLYAKTTLPAKPNEKGIKSLLLNCLEHHYGDLSSAVNVLSDDRETLLEIKRMLKGI